MAVGGIPYLRSKTFSKLSFGFFADHFFASFIINDSVAKFCYFLSISKLPNFFYDYTIL